MTLVLSVVTSIAGAAEPVDPDLIPEARAVLTFLESVYGKKTLAGIWGDKTTEQIKQVSGHYPAIQSFDLTGWNSPTWGPTYTPVVQEYVQQAKVWWAKGGIVAMQFHWKNPLKPDGTAWLDRPPGHWPFDVGKALQTGTDENKAVLEDLRHHADYLKLLADARVPVLWRPLHEIDGGWFWWTDQKRPENTAALWRLMFDYLVKERKLHNLIWVYSAGLHALGETENIAIRKRFYPGADYVDIAGIDIYQNDWFKWRQPWEDTYAKAFEIMQGVAPGKMLALAECGAIPDPDKMEKDGPKWLYCLPWWGVGKDHPEEWMRKTYSHPFVITLDSLPQRSK